MNNEIVWWEWRSLVSAMATAVLLHAATREVLPTEGLNVVGSIIARLFAALSPTVSILIEEDDDLYDAVIFYLRARCLPSSPLIRLSKPRYSAGFLPSLPTGANLRDTFRSVSLRWFVRTATSGNRYLELSFHSSHRDAVRNHYLPYILRETAAMQPRSLKLYTHRSTDDSGSSSAMWNSTPFSHPATFYTLALEPGLKEDIIADLRRFVARREYYGMVGRAWRRGYLLYGPPGTGKTTLIAAMANFLKFDVYEIDLVAVASTSHLRDLLAAATSKSVIVLENIDSYYDLFDRKKPGRIMPELAPVTVSSSAAGGKSAVSLAWLMSIVDGISSSSMGERIIVFTAHQLDRLDQALLRPGRVDRRIHLSYCSPAVFLELAKNYLEIGEGEEEGEMMAEAEAMIGDARMTPAEVTEVFMGCDGDSSAVVGLKRLLEEMRRRKGRGGGGGAASIV